MKRILLGILLFLLPAGLQAQMLAFNIEAPPELTVTVMSDGILEYGTLLQNQGQVQIQLMDPDTEIISIEGEHNRNVTVTISAPASLRLDASNTLPYTLGASYANQGENNKNQADPFPSNSYSFPIYDAQGGGTPPWAGRGGRGNQAGATPTATAYIYIYGNVNVGNVRAGTYTGTINVNVSYD